MMCDYWKLGAIAALALTAGACARDADRFPSLALRPGEIAPVAKEPEPETPIRTGIDPAQITALRERAAQAHAAFKRSERAAAPIAIAATGQSMESNARAAALVALADLRSKRGATAAVLADLDQLSAEAAASLAPDPALTAAQSEVLALLVREDEAMAEYWQVLAP